ncbi:OLC1v1022816C1 [Oldenlandia corymbosa var. corymbosa]|uniref:OLC1v1022816C1 n=1 Tax=Oldenlandia corymbosa var. corymbosa TaxID=529605 RepID=A0AAV1BYN0_OLDCO|nr:OLC1v1022816C1 [Oldenlandia corymbosa var. corymbosa]
MERLFSFNSIRPESKLYISEFYLAGEPLQFLYGLLSISQLSTWERFAEQLELRFGKVFRPMMVVGSWEATPMNSSVEEEAKPPEEKPTEVLAAAVRDSDHEDLESDGHKAAKSEVTSTSEVQQFIETEHALVAEFTALSYHQEDEGNPYNLQKSDELDDGIVVLDGPYSNTESMGQESFELLVDDELLNRVDDNITSLETLVDAPMICNEMGEFVHSCDIEKSFHVDPGGNECPVDVVVTNELMYSDDERSLADDWLSNSLFNPFEGCSGLLCCIIKEAETLKVFDYARGRKCWSELVTSFRGSTSTLILQNSSGISASVPNFDCECMIVDACLKNLANISTCLNEENDNAIVALDGCDGALDLTVWFEYLSSACVVADGNGSMTLNPMAGKGALKIIIRRLLKNDDISKNDNDGNGSMTLNPMAEEPEEEEHEQDTIDTSSNGEVHVRLSEEFDEFPCDDEFEEELCIKINESTLQGIPTPSCTFRHVKSDKFIIDFGISVIIIPQSVFKFLKLVSLNETDEVIKLVDESCASLVCAEDGLPQGRNPEKTPMVKENSQVPTVVQQTEVLTIPSSSVRAPPKPTTENGILSTPSGETGVPIQVDKEPINTVPVNKSIEICTVEATVDKQRAQSGYMWYQQPRLDLREFSGDDPQGWLRKCQKYFQLHRISEAEKLESIELFLDGKADTWYQGIKASIGKLSRSDFSELLIQRFGGNRGDQNGTRNSNGGIRSNAGKSVKGNEDKENTPVAGNGSVVKTNGNKGFGNKYVKKLLPQEYQYRVALREFSPILKDFPTNLQDFQELALLYDNPKGGYKLFATPAMKRSASLHCAPSMALMQVESFVEDGTSNQCKFGDKKKGLNGVSEPTKEEIAN